MIVDQNEIDLCFEDTGHEPDIVMSTTLPTMANVWMGYLSLKSAIKEGDIKILESFAHVKNITKWLGRSAFADL